jgi:hypothetical protein
LFCKSPVAQICKSFIEMSGEFFDDFGPLVWVQGEGAQVLADEFAPFRH